MASILKAITAVSGTSLPGNLQVSVDHAEIVRLSFSCLKPLDVQGPDSSSAHSLQATTQYRFSWFDFKRPFLLRDP